MTTLTNDELQEKLAIYGAEVDWVAKRQQSCDRVVENLIAKVWRLEARTNELEMCFKRLCVFLSIASVCGIIIVYFT